MHEAIHKKHIGVPVSMVVIIIQSRNTQRVSLRKAANAFHGLDHFFRKLNRGYFLF